MVWRTGFDSEYRIGMTSRSIEYGVFLDRMTLAALQVGAMALQFYGKVPNVGKKVGPEYSDDLHRAAAEALTDVDLAAQEILLYALDHDFPFVRVEPEEETPLVERFAANDSRYTVVLDPIDGTLNYLKGHGQFAVSFGLLDGDRFDAAIVYFPLLGELFRASRGGGLSIVKTERASPPRVPNPTMLFRDTAVPAEAVVALEEAGFPVERSGCSMVDSTAIATGLGRAAVCAKPPSIRRCIGALVSAEAGGVLCDLDGRPYDCTRPDSLDSLLIAPDRETADAILAAFRG